MTAAETGLPPADEAATPQLHEAQTGASISETRQIPPRPSTRAGRRLDRITASGTGRIDRLNRVLFGIVGVILAGAGGGGLLLGEGVIHGTSPGTLYARRATDAATNPDLAAGIAMALCLVVLLVALRWAFAQLRPVTDGERLATLTLFAGPRGRTTVAAASLAKAASADIASRLGVTSAKVRLRALQPQTRVTLSVELALDTDPDAVLGELQEALTRLLGALDVEEADSQTEIRLRFARPVRSRSERPSRVT
ncbi:MAG: hypothetical protein M3Y36_06085 [Actinomycetota bacterium]|nr:hypothetical protein [Actinomycetota bacterium]